MNGRKPYVKPAIVRSYPMKISELKYAELQTVVMTTWPGGIPPEPEHMTRFELMLSLEWLRRNMVGNVIEYEWLLTMKMLPHVIAVLEEDCRRIPVQGSKEYDQVMGVHNERPVKIQGSPEFGVILDRVVKEDSGLLKRLAEPPFDSVVAKHMQATNKRGLYKHRRFDVDGAVSRLLDALTSLIAEPPFDPVVAKHMQEANRRGLAGPVRFDLWKRP